MPIARIELYFEPDNAASLALARAAGSTMEGAIRKRAVILGKRYDVVLFARLVTDTRP